MIPSQSLEAIRVDAPLVAAQILLRSLQDSRLRSILR